MSVVQKKSAGSSRVGRDALRQRALEAARQVLKKEGLRALNARRIAGEIGAAVGTLYNLFENFDELILRLNLETLQALEAEFAAAPGPEGDAEAATLAIARLYLDFTFARRNEWAAVLEFTQPEQHRFIEDFRATIGRLVTVVERALAPLFAPGDDEARRLAAAILWTSLEGMSALSAADNLRLVTAADPWAMARSLIVNYLHGLKAGADSAGRADAIPAKR